MQAWLESVAGPEFAPALMWTVIALVGLLVLLVAVRIIRGLTFGTFVAGGRNRKARLAVMDATAVDSQRRLVLVRRDDVEHLILIGGPTDVVVEQNIRLVAPASARRPAEEMPYPAPTEPAPAIRSPAPVARPAPTAQPVTPPRPAPATRPVDVKPVPAAAPAHATASPAASYRPATPPRQSDPNASAYPAPPQASARPPVAPIAAVAATTPAPVSRSPQNLDEALLDELQVSLEKPGAGAGSSVDLSLDEEMSRLLSDLSAEKQR